MKPQQASAANPGPGPDGSALSASGPSLLEEIGASIREVGGLVHDQARLAALELRLAGQSLVAMIVAGIMIAILLASAWLGLMGVAVLALVTAGMSEAAAVLLAIAGNLAATLVLWRVIRHRSRHLQLPATVRGLQALVSEPSTAGQP